MSKYYTESLRRERRKANWIGHILSRYCLFKHVVEGKIGGRIKVTGRQGRRPKELLDDFKERRGFWKFKEGTIDGTLQRTCFRIWCRLLVRKTSE
jgi:hypothetical protein